MTQVKLFDTPSEVARAAADRFVEIARAAVDQQGRFSVALAGGSTPKSAYELLASEEYRDRVDWSKAHIFFGDERCVPLDDAESNYRMANEALLSRVPLPLNNIHRIEGLGDAAANAQLYEDELRSYFDDVAWPRFDLVLLGMGDDGHTASLFPGSPALGDLEGWVAANWVEKFGAYRITLTVPAINHAAHILFLVTGSGKAERLAEILGDEQGTARFPAQLIIPQDGQLNWFADKSAAAKISKNQ